MPFIKPENALHRAKEFMEVGKKQRALDTLYEVMRNKKYKTWEKKHEEIMELYLDLCVQLKESHMAKDGLHQYKNMCQNVNVKSLEEVLTRYLQNAEQQADKAKKDANIAACIDVDDLEVLHSPESILLKAVSGESSQDRADRDLLAPWLKFVWESYKQSLDLLKNNNKLENLYQQIAKQAFQFCVKYGRKTEFRKLCETLRQHMVQCQKYQNQSNSIDLTKPETQNLHLDTRLLQLNHAIGMDLWQEAYKAVEDIYGLMTLSKSKPKPSQMYHYYVKLSLIFWKAGNLLYHAATWHKLFVLIKEQKKNISQEELTRFSTVVLLATLAVPIPPTRSLIDESLETDETTVDRQRRLSQLLGLQQAPTRTSLIKDLIKYNVIQYVYPEIKDLYEWLEVEFNPLKLSARVNTCLDYLEKKGDAEFTQYIPAIKDITVMRLLKQISQIYTTIEISRFMQLAPFMTKFHLEKVIVDASKNNDLRVRINQQTKSLKFGNDLYVDQREELSEGPNIQSMPSEQIRSQLIAVNQALHKAADIISADSIHRKRDEARITIANLYRQSCDRHHIELLRRKQKIEEQKEEYERLVQQREQQEQQQREEEEKKRREEEEKKRRQEVESTRRAADDDRIREEKERHGLPLYNDEKEEQEQRQRQFEQLKKERREQDEKLRKEEKKIDHFIRACHETEVPMLLKAAKEDAIIRAKYWAVREEERVKTLQKEKQAQAENRDRLLRMDKDKKVFLDILFAGRNEEHEKRLREFEEKLKAAREAKLAERKEQRKKERKAQYEKEIEDKKKREEEEKRKQEEDARKRKLADQAETQRRREREIEEKYSKTNGPPPPQQRDREREREPQAKPVDTTDTWRRRGGDEPESGAQPTAAAGATAASSYVPPSARRDRDTTERKPGGAYRPPQQRSDKEKTDDHLEWRRGDQPPQSTEDRENRPKFERRDDRRDERRGDDRRDERRDDRRDDRRDERRDDRRGPVGATGGGGGRGPTDGGAGGPRKPFARHQESKADSSSSWRRDETDQQPQNSPNRRRDDKQK